jgi:hypothetical protein
VRCTWPELTRRACRKLAELFGGRDHTTVLRAQNGSGAATDDGAQPAAACA